MNECTYQSNKRLYNSENEVNLKRLKRNDNEQYDDSSSNSDQESKSIISDTDDSNIEDSIDDNENISTDQSKLKSVVFHRNIYQNNLLSRHSNKLIKKFHDIRNRCRRKSIESIANDIQPNRFNWKLNNSFDRTNLLVDGYTILSDESFPFHSVCYMCGSKGNDLIYCNSCCESYHIACLNDYERPRLYPTPESWLCPNCNLCNICGLTENSKIIHCSDCRRCFHIKCLKQSKEDDLNININNYLWSCPTCIKCDCGQTITSNEQNLLSFKKSLTGQQSLMCSECLTNMKTIRMKRHDEIEKCHFCNKFIEQFLTKPKPLFSLTLIGNQTHMKYDNLLKCIKCQYRFHPKCDQYLNEDVKLIPFINNISTNITCSKCDPIKRESIQNSLTNYKIQALKNTVANVRSTLEIIITEERRLNDMKCYITNLEQLHQSRYHTLNLHAFINDLLIIVQRLLENLDNRQWQAAIENCITSQCPWFKSSNIQSNTRTLICSSTNTNLSVSNSFTHRCLRYPSIDHTYSLNNERILYKSNVYKNNLLSSTDSLLRYIDKRIENDSKFENLHHIDTRMCQLCQIYGDNFSSNISRLILCGINQWVHVGCILPAYSKLLDQPPYILQNVNETVKRCQSKYPCEVCFKMGASVQCYANDCVAHFHTQCIDVYYSKIDRNRREQLNIINGLLPNLTTLCYKHNTNEIDRSKMKSINLSSAVYCDQSNISVNFTIVDIKLCIGSLQIKSFGNFDYLLDDDMNTNIYPNQFHATRVFWSTKNACEKTIYHLYIDIEQTYHYDKYNHQTIEYPLTSEEIRLKNFYSTCENYFNKFKRTNDLKTKMISKTISIDKKDLRELLTNQSFKSSNLSPFAFALAQAFESLDQSLDSAKTKNQQFVFSYYLSDRNDKTCSKEVIDHQFSIGSESIPQIDGNIDENKSRIKFDDLIPLYNRWLKTKFGRIKFTITSDDGFEITSENLDEAWSNILDLVRECRDNMNLTHLPMTNEHLNGHRMFGLTKMSIRTILNQLCRNSSAVKDDMNSIHLPLTSTNSNNNKKFTYSIKRKCSNKKNSTISNSRTHIYQRKDHHRKRFDWLLNSNQNIEYALKSFEIDDALEYAKKIIIEEPSVNLRLYHLRYFSERALVVGSSSIHGCGLFTLVDLVERQMIIEYTGEVIRSCLTDKRERDNEEKGYGCYMFTVDSMNVIDATHRGNKARFINHNCQPNCFAKTVLSGGIQHIVIYANRNISRGSELTYDYSFPEEDVKIPCHCGTSKCRTYLN